MGGAERESHHDTNQPTQVGEAYYFILLFTYCSSSLEDMFIDSRERKGAGRGRERKREKETLISCLLHVMEPGLKLQPFGVGRRSGQLNHAGAGGAFSQTTGCSDGQTLLRSGPQDKPARCRVRFRVDLAGARTPPRVPLEPLVALHVGIRYAEVCPRVSCMFMVRRFGGSRPLLLGSVPWG